MTQIIEDMPIEDYHALDSISKSGLDLINKSINHYLIRDSFGWTDATTLGALVHDLVFQQESRVRRVPISQKWGKTDYRDAECKKAKAQILARGDVPIRHQDYAIAEKMASNVMQVLPESMRTGFVESSMFWREDHFETNCRLRVDCYPFEQHPNIIVDLKTIRDASLRGMRKSVWEYRYHVQWAQYSAGIQKIFNLDSPPGFVICAVESTPPYNVAVFNLDPHWHEIGEVARLGDLERWQAYANGSNPVTGYPREIQLLTPFRENKT